MLLTFQETTARLGLTRAALYAAMAVGRLRYGGQRCTRGTRHGTGARW